MGGTMLESASYRGFWWLPENEAEKLSGELTVDRGKAGLAVLGSFGHEVLSESAGEAVLSGSPRDGDRILGHTTDGKDVTLEYCPVTNAHLSFPGIQTTTYRPRVVLFGARFTKGEEVTFDEISITTSDLDTWVAVSGISWSFATDDDPSADRVGPSAIDIHFEPPESIPIPLDDGAEAKITFSYSQSGMQPVATQATVSQTAALHLRRREPFTLDDVAMAVGWIRSFLTLAIGRTQTVTSITAFRDDLVHPGSQNRQPIELVWELQHNPELPRRPVHPQEIFFTLPQAKPNISEVMRAWIARQDLLRPVFNLYFGMQYHPTMYLDVRFLAYAQAIETYDFRRRDATDIPPEDHEQRLEAVLARAPDEHREWLRRQLEHGHTLTLRRRVRDVLAESPTVRDQIIGSTSRERGVFLNRFVDSRNYYTHYNPELENRAATGTALYLLVVQLQAIIEMCLLRELRFSCEDIDAILARVQRYFEIDHLRRAVDAGH